eukprot:344019-Pelagomonas_calceolata.AAC.1
MPSQLVYIIKDLYQDDKYILNDGEKRVSVQPTHGVKQRCPLSPLLFSIYVNDLGCITEGEIGVVTGLPNFRVSNMLCADDLALTAQSHPHASHVKQVAGLERKESYVGRGNSPYIN